MLEATPRFSECSVGPSRKRRRRLSGFAAVMAEVAVAFDGARVPISLYSIRICGIPSADARRVAEHALDSLGFVGCLPDRSIGFLYVGPHAGSGGEHCRLARMINRRLRASLCLLMPECSATEIELYVIHANSDALMRPDALTKSLVRLPARALAHSTAFLSRGRMSLPPNAPLGSRTAWHSRFSCL